MTIVGGKMIDKKLLHVALAGTTALAKKSTQDRTKYVLFDFLPDNTLQIVATNGHAIMSYLLNGVQHAQPCPTRFIVSVGEMGPVLAMLEGGTLARANVAHFGKTFTISTGVRSYNMTTLSPDNDFPTRWENVLKPGKPHGESVKVNADLLAFVCGEMKKVTERQVFHPVTVTPTGALLPFHIAAVMKDGKGIVTAAIMPM